MEEKTLFKKGYDIGYHLQMNAEHVIDPAIKVLDLPPEFLKGFNKGRKEGKRDKKLEQIAEAQRDDRAYWRHIKEEQQKQIDYDKLTPEQRMSKTNKKKAEDLKFKQEQELKDFLTDPMTIWLKNEVARELGEGKTKEANEREVVKIKDDEDKSKKSKEVIKDEVKTDEKGIESPYQEELTKTKEESTIEKRMEELEALQHKNEQGLEHGRGD